MGKELYKPIAHRYKNYLSNDVVRIQVMNVLGETVLETTTTNRLEVGDLPSGSYLLLLQDKLGYAVNTQGFLKL